MIANLVTPLTSLMSDVVKRILPEKISENDQLKLEAEIKTALMNADLTKLQEEIKDSHSARELAAKELEKGNAYTNTLAAIHRPIWSIVILIIFVWTLISQQIGLPQIILTDSHTTIMQTVIVFYFGGRSMEKIFKR